ncbi:putative glycosyltransferase, type 2 [Haloferax gibbonsii]|uniref:Glycosyltransferase, type 2 n=1 Tax=Haloferax gibbonsii TaxID=35746 RepID=A0A871BIY4_HALGI|nr:glycosyltransferase family 2 protein [Haloferax gibbonsii]QOS12740.1 putative glycosyltransferase, type 2 [Haloferax gibbonsii]
MTTTSNSPAVSFIIATYNRKNELQECIQSILDQSVDDAEIVIVSNSTDGTSGLFEQGGDLDHEQIRFFNYEGRMGVSEARNVGFQKANGDIYITIDDDAVISSEDVVEKVLAKFSRYPRLGAIAFQSVNYHTGEIEDKKVPKLKKSGYRDEPFFSSYFIGVGNAILSEVIDSAGDYPEDYTYGFEEVDLSYRIIREGYRIRYCPDIQVTHKESPVERVENDQLIQNIMRNRTKTSAKYLPWRYVISSTILWVLYSMLKTWGDPRPIISAMRDVYLERNTILDERRPLDAESMKYLREHHGRLLF